MEKQKKKKAEGKKPVVDTSMKPKVKVVHTRFTTPTTPRKLDTGTSSATAKVAESEKGLLSS